MLRVVVVPTARRLLRSGLLSVIALAMLVAPLAVPADAATARPAFQIPFRCEDRWEAVTRSGHQAIDWNQGNGSDDLGLVVTAAAAGIAQPKYQSQLGYHVDVDHGNGWVTRYAHLLAADRPTGPVAAGQMIGRVGNSGSSTAAHLHWEQRYDGVPQTTLTANGAVLDPDGRVYTSRNCVRRDPFLSGDVDGDGADDLVTRYVNSDGSSTVQIVGGNDTRVLPPRTALRLTPYQLPATALLSLGDTTGDGRADLNGAYASNGGVQIVSFYGRYDGTFGARRSRFFEANWPFERLHSVRAADIDGDGIDDLAARFIRTDGSTTLQTVMGAGARVLTRRRFVAFDAATLPASAHLAMGDTTGDTRADLNIAYRVNGAVRLASFYGTSTGSFAERRIRLVSTWSAASLKVLQSGDIDGDGIDDLVARSVARDGTSRVRVVRGARARELTGVRVIPMTSSVLPVTALVAVGDTTADGRADLNAAVRNTTGVRLVSFYGSPAGSLYAKRSRFYGEGWQFHRIS